MKNMRVTAVLIAAVLGHVATGGAKAATTLLNDAFTDTDYTNQSLSSSAKWLISSSFGSMAGTLPPPSTNPDGPSVATGTSGSASLKTNAIGGFYDWKAYFTTSGSPQVLGNGDSISVSFTVASTVANPTGANGFRVGLFNSNGVRQTTNLGAYGDTTFNGHQGYSVQYTPNATASTTTANVVQDRSAGTASNGLFTGTLTGLTNVGAPVVGTTAAFNTVLPVTLTITRSADGLKNTVTSSFAGATIVADDTAAPYTSFDELGIFFGSGWGATGAGRRENYIDNVVVTFQSAAVPEPASIGLIGLGGLLALRRRRA